MKKMTRLFFSTLTILLVTGMINAACSTGTDLQKTYTWKYNVNKDGTVSLENYDCNVIVHVWDKAETEFHLILDANTRTAEDATILDTYLQNLKFSNSAAQVSFKDTFWETRNNIMGRTTMVLEGGKKISLTDMSVKSEVWIPSACRFQLESKYSEVNMEDFAGQLNLNLYNDNFFGGSVKGKADIEDKYSTIEFKDMKDVKADLYNSKLTSTTMGSLKCVSKYSKVTTTTAGTLDIDSYNDKFSFAGTGDVTFTEKYSDLKTESSGKFILDCYEGSVITKEARDVSITSKYADFQFAVAGNINISSSYNDKLTVGKLTSLKTGDSKYCNYKFDEVTGSVSESDGYQDKFTILKAGPEFKGINIAGKYVDISISVAKTFDYKFKAKIEYPNLDMNESQLKSKTKIIEGSNLQYDAVKGAEKDGMPVIEVNGYQMGLKITEM